MMAGVAEGAVCIFVCRYPLLAERQLDITLLADKVSDCKTALYRIRVYLFLYTTVFFIDNAS